MRKQLLCLLAASGLCAAGATAGAAMQSQTEERASQIDYDGFTALTNELGAYRQSRLLQKDDFFRRAALPGALLLDTRSAAAFEAGHIEGAVNLPFSDFTEESLREVIGPNPNRPIFIYCNNNFADDAAPVVAKKAPLALNIPTFINLYGYGYENIWELDGVMLTAEVAWVGDLPQEAMTGLPPALSN
ncbi:rhodanese-like domain-containing protein [Salipiger bermudensis]|uniref:rhodanese-like domain-containing protein n=2 Tax=Alphaproteobacteria TaxID=28211 RepID=UPI0035193272